MRRGADPLREAGFIRSLPVFAIADKREYANISLMLLAAGGYKEPTVIYGVRTFARHGRDDLMPALKAAGAKMCKRDFFSGKTPLQEAAAAGYLATVKILHELGCSFNIRDKKKRSALDDAANPELVQYMKENGARYGRDLGFRGSLRRLR